MKLFLPAIILSILISCSCFAQTQKGSKMLGGSGSVNFKEAFSLSLSPNLGYFIIEDLALGSGVSLNYSNFKEIEFQTFGGGVEPFIRYYFGKPAPIRVFAQANGSVYLLTIKNKAEVSTHNRNAFGGSLGIAYFISQQIGVEARLTYNNFHHGHIDPYENQYYPRENNFGLNFGIQVHLPHSGK